MPPDTYEQTATNPTTGEKFGYDGSKWVPIGAPSATKRLITQAIGLPEDVDTSWEGNKKALSSMGDLDTWINALKQAASNLNPYAGHGQTVDTAVKRFSQPGAANKVSGALQYLESGFPFAGGPAARSQEQFVNKDYAGSAGSAINAALLAKIGPEAAKRAATGPLRTASQFVTGVGKDVVEQSRKKFGEDLAKLNEQIETAKGKNEASRTGVVERQNLTSEAQNNAKQIGSDLQNLREEERAVAKALYPEVGGTADSAALHKQLQQAVEGGLKGSEKVPTAVGRVLSETSEIPGKSTGPAIAGRTLDLSNASDIAAYKRYKASGAFTPEEIARIEGKTAGGMTFDKLHGYYSELGKAAYNLEGDERAATLAAKKVIGDQMEKMAAAENKSYRFGVAQKNWAQLENTFYNTSSTATGGSPIARALRAIDPISKEVRPEYVQAILSEPKAYSSAQKLLSRYKGARNIQAAMSMMVDNLADARKLPKSVKEVPVPKAPSREIFDPVAARREILQGKVPTGVTPGLFWRYALLRNLMRKLTNLPSAQDYLSQNPK